MPPHFLIVYLCSPNTGTYIYFLKIHISSSFSGVMYVIQPLLNPTQYFCLDLPHTNPCLSCVIIVFSIFPVYLFLACYPPLTRYPLKMTWNRWTNTSHVPMLHTFERIRSVPRQCGVPYLKETQPEWKPETCTGKAIKVKEMLNSSNNTLITYLSDINKTLFLAVSA